MIQEFGNPNLTNRMLQALLRTRVEPFLNHFEVVELPQHRAIFRAGAPIDHLYFINRGLVSRAKIMADGRAVEVGAIGSEGIVGLFALHGIKGAMWEYVVRVPGTAFRINCDTFDRQIAQTDAASALLRRYTHTVIETLSQTAACNRLHTLRQRFCHWLLLAHDGAHHDSFPLTHELLALTLGVQRAGVSITANTLQKAGLIRYKHGHVTILDRARLEMETCECYAIVRRQFDELFAPSQPKVAMCHRC
jgi:CRP-like cAMP-binding protein